LDSYGHACAVSQLKFAFTGVVEAQAAHIIAKEVNGTDDPRNGLALSRTAHWAFDQGIFTITDQYEVQIHPKALFADHRNFQLFDLDKKNILLPNDDSYLPHPDALRWHRENVFGKFIKR
jgi:putative restriction endonuclease